MSRSRFLFVSRFAIATLLLLTKAGGITWHDLRHTFATRLRGERVHELDIMQLLGHSSLGVTAGYAHGTPTVIQSAVDKLAEPRGEVVEFVRRAV